MYNIIISESSKWQNGDNQIGSKYKNISQFHEHEFIYRSI